MPPRLTLARSNLGRVSLNLSRIFAIVIGALLAVVGTGIYRGKGKLVRRLPGLTDSQQGLAMAAAGAILLLWGVLSSI